MARTAKKNYRVIKTPLHPSGGAKRISGSRSGQANPFPQNHFAKLGQAKLIGTSLTRTTRRTMEKNKSSTSSSPKPLYKIGACQANPEKPNLGDKPNWGDKQTLYFLYSNTSLKKCLLFVEALTFLENHLKMYLLRTPRIFYEGNRPKV